jgi:hypothetical protein
MVTRVSDINGIPLYEDKYMDTNKAITSYKKENGLRVVNFIVAGSRVISLIKQYNRNKTLEEILEMI